MESARARICRPIRLMHRQGALRHFIFRPSVRWARMCPAVTSLRFQFTILQTMLQEVALRMSALTFLSSVV